MKNSLKTALSLVAIATISACGGGGSSSAPEATALSIAPECKIGTTVYPSQTIVPDTCKAVAVIYQVAVDSSITAIKARDAANAAQAAAIVDRDKALASLQVSNANLAASVKTVADTQSKLTTATTNLDAAIVNRDKALAALAVANSTAADQLKAAQALAAQAAADKAAANAAVAQAAIDKAAAQQLSIKAATDAAISTTAAAKAAADLLTAQAAAVTAAADKASAVADLVLAQAAQTDAAAKLTEAKALANATGLPICAVPIPTNQVLGKDCVLTPAQQVTIYADGQAAANAFKFIGAYQAINATVVSEAGGKIWISDEDNKQFMSGTLSAQTGTTFTGSSSSLTANGGVTAALSGTYALNSTDATLKADYGTTANVTTKTFALAKNVAAVTIGPGTLAGESGAGPVAGSVTMTVLADNTFTGKEGPTCTFEGKFEGGADVDYKKVTIKFVSNVIDSNTGLTTTKFCDGNKSGQTATGVLALRDKSYVIMASLPGVFTDQVLNFREGFSGNFTGTAKIASASNVIAQATNSQSIALAFLNGSSKNFK